MTLEQEYQVQQFAIDAQMAAYDHFDDLFPAESYYECDRCHDTIPDTGSTLNYCQNCGARVVYKETDDAN